MYDQVEFYGRIFNRQQDAATAVARLRERVAKVQEATTQGTALRTAAAVFVPVGGGQLYTYGIQSMVNAQMTTAGLTNVYGDVDRRAIETSFEDILGRDPDVLMSSPWRISRPPRTPCYPSRGPRPSPRCAITASCR